MGSQIKLSPYSNFDFIRAVELLRAPNFRLDTLLGVSPPHDTIFPETGLIHLQGAVSTSLCDQAVEDYKKFECFRRQKGCLVTNPDGRNYRLVNFHLESDALLEIGLSSIFHELLTNFFGRKSSIYTSLTFKHGSQQEPHIDTPYFWTRPFNLFGGVWVALEDISPEAGPLFYYPGSHKYFNSEAELAKLHAESQSSPDLMFEKILQKVSGEGITKENVIIEKGDAVIWHPGLLHGGNRALDQAKTRFSAVFHFAPVGVNVRMHGSFPRNFINFFRTQFTRIFFNQDVRR
jgi:hypothetical protein